MKSQVSLVACPDYVFDTVFAAVRRSIDCIGGIGRFVQRGRTALIKPNLLSLHSPEDGVNTHPEVIRAVVRMVREAGGRPVIGDSPGGFSDSDYIDRLYIKSGMKAVADGEGAELVKFTSSRNVRGIPLATHVLDADCVISVPKFKTHELTVITAGIKNMYGAVVGPAKMRFHLKGMSQEAFVKILADIYEAAKPDLTVLDAVVAMEGAGPATGSLRKMEFIAASDDAVAMDAVLAKIIGLESCAVMATAEAYRRGLGEADLAKIDLLGDGIGRFTVNDFKLPQTSIAKMVPKALARRLTAIIRFKPVIDGRSCTRCMLCQKTCPVSAIAIGKTCTIDYSLCVRCLCCREVCPQKAIRLRRNILAKMIWG